MGYFVGEVLPMATSTWRFATNAIFILRAAPSAAGVFWHFGIAIWEARCLHFDIPGNYFNTPGASQRTILAPRDRPGKPWEQQDGLEVIVYMILFDLGVIAGFVYIGFSNSRS